MTRQVNGFLGSFTSVAELNTKFPPSEHGGCFANIVLGTTVNKYISDGNSWQSLVSVAGNLTYAAVATTTGTPGEVRKLSDGPDAGAVLVWAIPEGSTSYAWCWQIYPLAAYL